MEQNLTSVTSQEVSSGSSDIAPSQLVIDSNQSVHLLWIDSTGSASLDKTYYTTLQTIPQPSDSQISQTIQVPAPASHPGLSFLYELLANGLSNDELSVEVAGTGDPVQAFSTHQTVGNWTHVWIDLSDWAGQSVTLTFKVHANPGYKSGLAYLDEISVGTTCADAWVKSNPQTYAFSGRQITLPISLGNQARIPAQGAVFTLTLPAGLTFVSASIAPTTTDPALTWDLGDLAAQSTTTIWVTLQIDPTVPTFTALTYSATLTQSSPEVETANNTATGVVNTNLQVLLPVMMK